MPAKLWPTPCQPCSQPETTIPASKKWKHQPVRYAAAAQIGEGGYSQNDERWPPGERVHLPGSFSLVSQGTL